MGPLMLLLSYKFIDFVKVGVPLVIIVWLILTWVLALAYGL